jgi:pimeloyl-ACP methyl ester carboxylesterase
MARMAHTTIRPALLAMLSLIGLAFGAKGPPSTVWTAIAVDPKGDVRARAHFDAAQLSYQYDPSHDLFWLRLSLFSKPDADRFKIDLAIDTGAPDTRRATWWGTNKDFKFDLLASVRITKKNGAYFGALNVRAAEDSIASSGRPEQHADVSVTSDSILIGLERRSLIGTNMKMNLIAAIGSNDGSGDDIPNLRSAAVDLSAPRPTRGLRELDVSRNNLTFALGQPTIADTASPRIARYGRGPRTLILIPGVYSGAAVFDGFMARNASTYTFHVLTPPGLNGTAARTLPSAGKSVGEFTWTRRLAHDIRELIARNHLKRPVVVAHGFPGTLAAEELAVTHPHLLGGIVEVAGMPPQFFPSPASPTLMATPAERVRVVDESWVRFWFKYVTPETWETNNYPADMYANDPQLSERARQQVESAPLPVKIRYLIENMASDRREDLAKMEVRTMALIPGFNQRLLKDPALGWFKTSFQESWEPLRRNPRIELTVVPDARALMLDDQPAFTDAAIARFVERHTGRASSAQRRRSHGH